jgi:hypothetical protein
METMEMWLDPAVVAVFKLVFIAFFSCHLFGCLWWMVSDLEINEEMTGADSEWLATPWYAGHNNWHPPRWLTIEGSLGMKYGHSFFWGAGMVTSLVPRDIEPLTILESMLTTTTMFFGLLLNAFVISSLTQVRARHGPRTHAHTPASLRECHTMVLQHEGARTGHGAATRRRANRPAPLTPFGWMDVAGVRVDELEEAAHGQAAGADQDGARDQGTPTN